MTSLPAILGGKPITEKMLPFVRPCLPKLDDLREQYEEILRTGMVTTGPYTELFGEKVAAYLGVQYAVAVSSCTTGLLLATQSLALPEGSEVILPSFTFIASGLGPVWNRLKLRFVDVDLETMNIDPQKAEEAITSNTSAVIGVHQFGNPAPIEELQRIALKNNLALYFDSAHGFGAYHNGQRLGRYGKAEIFSMTPTKLLIAGEGGMVTTNDSSIADHIRYSRNYGNPGNYDCLYPGLNARMSEFHAIAGLHSLERLEEASLHRNKIVLYYRERLAAVPGISFQKIADNCRSSCKDFSIVIDEKEYGIGQSGLFKALQAENIQTRVYYSPILHQMKAFCSYAPANAEETLKNSIYLQTHALSLPLYSDMKEEEAGLVCVAIERLHSHAKEAADNGISGK